MYKWSLGVGTNIGPTASEPHYLNVLTLETGTLEFMPVYLFTGNTFVHAPNIARNGFSLALNPQNKQIRLINEQTRRVTSIFGGGE